MASAAVNEFICEDCGTLLVHTNPNTLESMKDVHNQLCFVKRQKNRAAEAAKAAAARPAAGARPAAPSVSGPQPSMPGPSAPPAPTMGGGATTVSLTGSGSGYSKVDGPIDVKFKDKRQSAGTFQGIKVWGPV
ncbi:MAG: hypothetical protein ABI361_12405, partial [Nitrososphaera sp.]